MSPPAAPTSLINAAVYGLVYKAPARRTYGERTGSEEWVCVPSGCLASALACHGRARRRWWLTSPRHGSSCSQDSAACWRHTTPASARGQGERGRETVAHHEQTAYRVPQCMCVRACVHSVCQQRGSRVSGLKHCRWARLHAFKACGPSTRPCTQVHVGRRLTCPHACWRLTPLSPL